MLLSRQLNINWSNESSRPSKYPAQLPKWIGPNETPTSATWRHPLGVSTCLRCTWRSLLLHLIYLFPICHHLHAGNVLRHLLHAQIQLLNQMAPRGFDSRCLSNLCWGLVRVTPFLCDSFIRIWVGKTLHHSWSNSCQILKLSPLWRSS